MVMRALSSLLSLLCLSYLFLQNRFYKYAVAYVIMSKHALKILQIIVWILGFIALGLLVWGIIREII